MQAEPFPGTAPPSRTPSAANAGLIGLCLLGLGLRLWLGWWMGLLGDLQCWQLWGLDPGEYVSRAEYPSNLPLPNNYPPLYPSVLRIMRWVHRDLHLPGDYTRPVEIHYHENPDAWRPLILYLKIPPILSDLVTAVLLFLIGRRFARPWLGVGMAAFYLFSPAILYDGAYYGQTDTILIMFLVAALWAYFARRSVWLGAMLVMAALTKAQAVFALPVLGLAVLGNWRGWRPHWWRVILGGLISLGIVFALAWWTGQTRQFYNGYFTIVGMYPLVTSRAFNLWWLLTRPWDKPPAHWDFPLDSVKLFGLISYRMIGAVLFFSVLGLILWRLHRARYTPHAVMLAVVAAGWAFFNLPTQMHDRYSIPAVGLMTLLPLFAGSVRQQWRWWGLALLVSLTATLNIANVCYFFSPPAKPLMSLVNWFIFPEQHLVWVAFAVIHVLMVPLLIEALWREASVPQAEIPPAGGFPAMQKV